MSTRLQVVDTRPRVFREAVASPISRLAADFSSAFDRARTEQKQAAQLAADRAFREKMQRLGFEHEDTQQERGFTHDSNEAVADRLFRQQSQDRLFGHEDTARRETFEHDSKENEANRGVTRRGQDITAQGIANDFNLGNRRLGLEAIQIGGQLQHYRAQDAAGGGVGGANRFLLTPGDYRSLINTAAGQRGIDPDSILPRAREYADSAQAWALRPFGAPTGSPASASAYSPSAGRMSADGAPTAAATDSIAEQQAHWDAAAASLKARGVDDVEGQIGPRPGGRR